MDWLKDKKNQPIVAAILAVVIVGALAAVLLPRFLDKGSDEAATPPPTDPNAMAGMTGPPNSMPPGATPPGAMGGPPQPGAPAGATPAAGGATQATPAPAAGTGAQASAKPMETFREDPFLPVGYTPPKKNQPKPKPRIVDLPIENWSKIVDDGDGGGDPDVVQPVRRMAGLIVSDRLFAIIETNGTSEIVQPGDMLKDRKAYVQKIERDKVVLKTVDKKPKYLTVRMASAPKVDVPETTSTGGGTMMPGGMRYPMMGPMGPMRPAGPMAPM